MPSFFGGPEHRHFGAVPYPDSNVLAVHLSVGAHLQPKTSQGDNDPAEGAGVRLCPQIKLRIA